MIEQRNGAVAQPRWSTSSRDAVSEITDEGKHPDLPSLLPLSHDHPMLTASAEDWSVDDFLLTRLHVPLEELRGELREYLGVLKEELGASSTTTMKSLSAWDWVLEEKGVVWKISNIPSKH